MADAIKLKVPKEQYQQTIDELTSQLDQLNTKKADLRSIINRLQGDTFSGSDVQSTIDLAQESLERVEKAYSKITRQRDTIQEYLNSTEADASTLQSATGHVRDELPDLFK